ncbi:MAG: hypothetical protein M5R36_15955 [Deltaproteobacteria bacterium]|nr:hypothetical protein [Deltaproteobacteria bacterium]
MIGHITYLSDASMSAKFGRRLQDADQRGFRLDVEYQVESYLRHQGQAFVERFDGNAYLYITRAMDYYDASDHGRGDLVRAVAKAQCAWMAVSFTSDWLYPPSGSREFVRALVQNRQPVSYFNIDSPYGHDAFLLETERLSGLVAHFLETVQAKGPGHGA